MTRGILYARLHILGKSAKFIRMSKFYDIPGKKFDFASDLSFGLEGEELIKGFLDSLSGGDFEVKSDRYRNGRMVIETQQNPKGAKDSNGALVWVNSGINVTLAKWWVYIYTPEEAFLVVSVARMKRFLRANNHKYNEQTKVDFGGADNPARGFLVYPEEVLQILINPQYDKPIYMSENLLEEK